MSYKQKTAPWEDGAVSKQPKHDLGGKYRTVSMYRINAILFEQRWHQGRRDATASPGAQGRRNHA
jgi:hypothetical protein